jgi:hypothetical protein
MFEGVSIVRIAARAICIATGLVGLIGWALAADLSAANIKAFAIGKTVYLGTTAPSVTGAAGQGVL